MKNFFIYFFITFFFTFSSLSNDINEFEIGQISLGTSLLDYVEKDQIDFLKEDQKDSSDKYIVFEISKRSVGCYNL